MHAFRKLLVLGLNELISKNLISLAGSDEPSGHYVATIANETCIIRWNSINAQELSFSVWWKFDASAHPKANLARGSAEYFAENGLGTKEAQYPKFVGATVSGWLERRTGKFIQGKGTDGLLRTYMRRGEKAILDALPSPAPLGFKADGEFIR